MDRIAIESDICAGLDARQVRYLKHCLDRLPDLATLIFHQGASWTCACWHVFVDALPRCKGTKRYSDPDGGYSKKEAKRFLAAFHDNPVIRELGMDVMRNISLFCICHQATDTLHWLVVHAAKGALDLRGSRLAPGEAGWPIHWTRAAPCAIKLRLDQVALTKQDIACN